MSRHPSRAVVAAFLLAVLVGAALLELPISARSGHTQVVTALFTATSAVCVTGLTTVDTAAHWTVFGQVVIMVLIQVGGFGIMTMASLLGLLVSHRIGLRSRLTVAAESRTAGGLGDVGSVLRGVIKVTVVMEAGCAILLAGRFYLGYHEPLEHAAWLGVFHAVSSFNNAGFALYPDSLLSFVSDPWVCLPIAATVIIGGLGFPVLFELRRRLRRPRTWSVHTKLTLAMTLALLVAGTVFITANEWTNPATLGELPPADRLLAGNFQAVMPRTAGFNTLDYAEMNRGTWLATIVLMFIGGGSASTAGGIKVTTFVVLFFALVAEVRGEESVNAFDRQISARVQRQALTVALLSMAAIVAASLLLVELTKSDLAQILFEATSAFATVGLSTGLTPTLPPLAQMVLAFLMFLGRLGPVTLVSALALRDRQRLYRLPEGRPLIG
ncbi:MAG: TrkH family potassium uptake protein [Microlunatus sp.]|nr:TrkH family potassium uptake protein [Microlunatus sp.]MDN5769506.1 TrkH family potassium uptake protein [Microlunatus sp.]